MDAGIRCNRRASAGVHSSVSTFKRSAQGFSRDWRAIRSDTANAEVEPSVLAAGGRGMGAVNYVIVGRIGTRAAGIRCGGEGCSTDEGRR